MFIILDVANPEYIMPLMDNEGKTRQFGNYEEAEFAANEYSDNAPDTYIIEIEL
jgi:hypothetical protein